MFKGADALRRENKVVENVVKELGLSKTERSLLHEELHGMAQDAGRPLKYQEIKQLAQEMFPK